MDPVNSLSQLMRTLRQQISAQAQKSKRSGSKDSHTQIENARQSTATRTSLEEVQARIQERVRQLGTDKDDSRLAAQIFVESILAWEFGEEALQDPRFQELSKDVQETMMSDPETWKKFRGLLQKL